MRDIDVLGCTDGLNLLKDESCMEIRTFLPAYKLFVEAASAALL